MSRERTALSEADREDVFEVIDAAAGAYAGVIPEESDTDPYVSMDELEAGMDEMQFFGIVRDRLEGVIGAQERSGVSLIRHLYVRPDAQREWVGTDLLTMGIERTDSSTVLVGTWAAADWAIESYETNGFANLGTDVEVLSTYWEIPDHQREASVVLRYEK